MHGILIGICCKFGLSSLFQKEREKETQQKKINREKEQETHWEGDRERERDRETERVESARESGVGYRKSRDREN